MSEERDDRHTSIHATHAVVGSELTFGSVTDKISAIVLKRKTPIWWFVGFAISFALFQDRKSTRLNSSHSQISYAVFCLKKKKKNNTHNNNLNARIDILNDNLHY